MQDFDDPGISRRDFLIIGVACVAATAVPLVAKAQAPAGAAPVISKVSFQVNGKAVNVDADPSTPVLWALRELTGKDAGYQSADWLRILKPSETAKSP